MTACLPRRVYVSILLAVGMLAFAPSATASATAPNAGGSSVSIGGATVSEGAGTATLTLSISPPAGQAGTITFDSADGSALGGVSCAAGIDYVALESADVPVTAGATSVIVSVALCDDSAIESSESFSVAISAATAGFTPSGGPATVTITDNDLPHLSVGQFAPVEGNSGSRVVNMTVRLTPAWPSTVSVQYQFVAGGTATKGSASPADYNGSGGTLTFSPNTATRMIPVTIFGDTSLEGNETILLHLLNPSGAVIDVDPVTGTIVDDECPADTTIMGTDGADTINGTPGNDVICARAGNDAINPGGGNDVVYGGPGLDKVGYSEFSDGGTIDLGSNGATGSTTGPSTGNDALFSIENAMGTQGNDTLLGNELANVLDGRAGNDTIRPGLGNDTVAGGPGVDLGDYATSGDVVIRLDRMHPTAVGPQTGSDKLTGIEDVTTGSGNDVVYGSGAANVLNTGAGDDTLFGLIGNDTLVAGSGNDVLYGGPDNDTIDGGTGTDEASFASSPNPVVVNLAQVVPPQATGQGSDTLTGIENVFGSAYNDSIIGDDNDNYLSGWDGADTIIGGAGNDVVHGNGGDDPKLDGSSGADLVLGDRGALDGYVSASDTYDNLTGGDGTDYCSQGDGTQDYNGATCEQIISATAPR